MAVWQKEITVVTIEKGEETEAFKAIAGAIRCNNLLIKKWMYDFLVEFLSSPVWRVSILDFTDNKCLVFDNEEENKFEYTIIHNVSVT